MLIGHAQACSSSVTHPIFRARAHFALYIKNILDLQVFSRIVKQWKSYNEFQTLSWTSANLNILIMFTDGVETALSILMDWETFNWLAAFKQIRGVIRALQRSLMVLLVKIVSNLNLTLSFMHNVVKWPNIL